MLKMKNGNERNEYFSEPESFIQIQFSGWNFYLIFIPD